MSNFAKFLLSMSMIAFITAASSMWQVAEAGKPASVTCTISVVNTIRTSSGIVFGTETYQRNFVVSEGTPFSDDFSNPLRFKFFDASMRRVNGETVVDIRWFADVSVFDSVDFGTALRLSNGQKTGETSGEYTFSFSGGDSTTTYTLVGVRN